jgi:hypothetical protein
MTTTPKRGLLPLSGSDLTVFYQVGLTDVDLRDLHEVILATPFMTKRRMLVLFARLIARRGVRKVSPLAVPSPSARRSAAVASAGNGPSAEAQAKLDEALAQVAVGATSPAGIGKRMAGVETERGPEIAHTCGASRAKS